MFHVSSIVYGTLMDHFISTSTCTRTHTYNEYLAHYAIYLHHYAISAHLTTPWSNFLKLVLVGQNTQILVIISYFNRLWPQLFLA